jgi:hypothetical protein
MLATLSSFHHLQLKLSLIWRRTCPRIQRVHAIGVGRAFHSKGAGKPGKNYKSALRIVAVATALAAGTMLAHAEKPMVGGAAMYADKNIVENAVNSKDHTTLVAAVKAAGLVETLCRQGPIHGFRAN